MTTPGVSRRVIEKAGLVAPEAVERARRSAG